MKEKMDVVISEEDLEIMRLILSRKNVAEQALNRVEFPEGFNVVAYYEAGENNLARAKYDEIKTWKEWARKYNLGSTPTSLDIDTGEMFKVDEKN